MDTGQWLGASWPSWLLYIDTMETTLGGQFFLHLWCKQIVQIYQENM